MTVDHLLVAAEVAKASGSMRDPSAETIEKWRQERHYAARDRGDYDAERFAAHRLWAPEGMANLSRREMLRRYLNACRGYEASPPEG